MDKLKVKRQLKQVERDLQYFMEEYNLSQKEAYEVLYERYYTSMRLVQGFVEIEARERIHNSFKEDKNETKN